jgi:hypothetical protein
MHGWSLWLLVFLLVIAGFSEGSKFKQIYPDYKSYHYQHGHIVKERSEKIPNFQTQEPTEEPPHLSKERSHPTEHQHTHTFTSPQPLPSQISYLEYVGIILVGAVLVYIQLRKFNSVHSQKLHDSKEEEEERETESKEEVKQERTGEELSGEKTVEQDTSVACGEGEKLEEIESKIEHNEGGGENDHEGTDVNMEDMENKKSEKVADVANAASEGECTVESATEKAVKEEDAVDEQAYSDEEWVVVNRDGSTSISKNNYNNQEIGELKPEDMQLEPCRNTADPMRELNTMLEKLQIHLDPDAPMSERLEVAKLIQTEKKLIIKRAQFTKNFAVKRRSLEIQKMKEERSREKELARQNSVKEELHQRQIRDDEFHRSVILHGSVGIMLYIWLNVMNFSLFNIPFLTLPSSSTFSYLPTSLSVVYNLASWVNTARLFYALALLVACIFLWTFVSSLAPYIVLLFAFMHAWQSFFRAGIYFVFLWMSTSVSFSLMHRVRFINRYKFLKLVILYSFNWMAAGLIGGIVAHGDPLNPYRIHFYSDSLAEQLFSYLY